MSRSGLPAAAGIALLVFTTPFEGRPRRGGRGRLPASLRPRARWPGGLPSPPGSEAHASLRCCSEADAVSPPVSSRSVALGDISGRARSRDEAMSLEASPSASPPRSRVPCAHASRVLGCPRRAGDPGVPRRGDSATGGVPGGPASKVRTPESGRGDPAAGGPRPRRPLGAHGRASRCGGPRHGRASWGGGPRHEQNWAGRGGGSRDRGAAWGHAVPDLASVKPR